MAQTRSRYYAKAYTSGFATFPVDEQITGTMTVAAGNKQVACSGTAANFANIQAGDWLVLKTTTAGEVIRITGIDNDRKFIFLADGVINTHTAINIYVVKDAKTRASLQYVSVVFEPVAGIYINGNELDEALFVVGQNNKLTFPYFNEPIIVESTGRFQIHNGL